MNILNLLFENTLYLEHFSISDQHFASNNQNLPSIISLIARFNIEFDDIRANIVL
ncbi:unnamed protein product [Rotaria sp. Silwood2]|nr:unnamed protein product [Rotaria sp. Silwood2]